MSAKIVCGAVAAVVAAWSGSARADCTELDKDAAAWASKLVVRGAMAVIDCDTCTATPARIKKVEVHKAPGDPSLRTITIDGRVVDLSTVFVQTGAETFTSVGALVGCTGASDAMVRRVGKDDASGLATGVPECDRYVAVTQKYMQCNQIPQAAKDAMRQGIDSMKQGWQMLRDPNVPAEAKRAANDACREAIDALKQSAAAMGCPM